MSIVEKALEKIKPENRQFVAKSKALADQVYQTLQSKGISQKEVAEKLGKQPSEISKWLSGMHNPTLRTITNLEVLLGTDLMLTPAQAQQRFAKREYVYMTVYASTPVKVIGNYQEAARVKKPAQAISPAKGIKAA